MKSDQMLMELLTESHRPFILVLTKADKVPDKEVGDMMQKIITEHIKTSGTLCHPTVHSCSSLYGSLKLKNIYRSGYGMFELMSDIAYINAEIPILRKPT